MADAAPPPAAAPAEGGELPQNAQDLTHDLCALLATEHLVYIERLQLAPVLASQQPSDRASLHAHTLLRAVPQRTFRRTPRLPCLSRFLCIDSLDQIRVRQTRCDHSSAAVSSGS